MASCVKRPGRAENPPSDHGASERQTMKVLRDAHEWPGSGLPPPEHNLEAVGLA